MSDSGSSSWRHKPNKTLVGQSLRLSATTALAYLADRTQLQIRGFVAGFTCFISLLSTLGYLTAPNTLKVRGGGSTGTTLTSPF